MLLLALAPTAVAEDASYRCAHALTCGGANGHTFTEGARFPFSEDISTPTSTPIARVTISGPSAEWTVLQSGCTEMTRNTNIVAAEAFNTRLLGYLRIDDAIATAGTRYEVQFTIDGNPYGWYIRAFRGMLPQGDHFAAVAANLPAGPHSFEIRARMLDRGSLTFGQQFTTSMGAPAHLPIAGKTSLQPIQVGAQWTPISETVTFFADEPVDLFPSAYFQFDSGIADQQISVGFSLDGQHAERTSEIAVPQFMPDGVNILDHIAHVSAGIHTLTLWAVDRDGGSVSLAAREVSLIGYPVAEPFSAPPILVDAAADDEVLVDSFTKDGQPRFEGDVCGAWTKVLEFDVPAVSGPGAGAFNYTGDGYFELRGRNDGEWSNTAAQMAVEVTPHEQNPFVVDFHYVEFSVPEKRGEMYFYIDAMLWGAGVDQTVRLWIRKENGCGRGGPGSFRIGKRHVALKLIPSADVSCYVR